MKFEFSAKAIKSYQQAPPAVRKAFDKMLHFLLTDLKHPSLHAKKFDESQGIWQGRVTLSWRFYFKIEGDTYFILDLIPHPK